MNQDKLLYGIVAVLAVLLVAYLAFVKQVPAPAPSTAPVPDASPVSSDATSTTTTAPPPTPAPTKALTYEQALKTYAGYRLQFVGCHGTPGTLNVTVGKKFMLDNRDKTSHTIVIGSTPYKLGGNGFAIVSAPTKPGPYNVTCDGGGAANLTVQK